MKSSWIFLLWFLLILIAGDLNSIHVLSNDDSQVLNSAPIGTSLMHLKPSALKYFFDQGPTLLVLQNGTIYYQDGKSKEPLWSFSAGSSISSIYQSFSENDGKENIYEKDAGLIPYPFGTGVDFRDDFLTTENSDEKDMMKIVKDYVAKAPVISKDEIRFGERQTIIKVLDAKDGSLIDEFNFSALPSGEKNASVEMIYIVMKVYTLNSYALLSRKMLWNLTVSEIRAALHTQGNVVPVPVLHIRDGAHFQFLLENLNHKDGELLHITNDDVILNPTVLAPFEDTKNVSSSTILAIGGSTDSKSTSLATIETKKIWNENKNFGLRNIAYLTNLCLLAVLLLCGPWYIFKRLQSTKQLNESRGQKTTVPKRKKVRKVGSYKKSVNNEKNDISCEKGEDCKGYPNSGKDGLGFKLGITEDCSSKGRMVGTLFVSNIEIAKGSNGTVVLEGMSIGRPVAVKRLVQAHHDVADKEIHNLILSDQHPNIVRLYGVERDSDFVYLSLERCTCSLYDLIQISSDSSQSSDKYNLQFDSAKNFLKDVELWKANGHPSSQLLKIMREVIAGVAHLHELGIIHRDLKPQNILINKEKSLCAKISDMGISKRLVGDNASLGHHPTGYGSLGWQAPEQILHGRQTRAVDLFSLGCVFFFCITGGKHPFGDRHFEREANIIKHADHNDVDFFMVEHIPEAVDLLSHLLDPKPEARPSIRDVVNHPLFWNSETRLSFFRDASDRVELEDRENDSNILKALENVAPTALDGNWDTKMETTFINNIGRYRRYKFDSMRDLLRVIRNKLNHYRELPKEIQEILGPVPDGFNGYFASRFPRFLIEVYKICYKFCKEEEWFMKYFNNSVL
ncbi:Serine/threonine-protein kinase/endoribonuclease IRE1a [Thalictrum thalictroides]|uniref:non-specific serine/threonine protein kinase n=1 Tax=Thalictrum thalictroides TaxID=46969 RepID=A0A7J6X843_THATH|nr:Serine/threonine-protein kinase/endoribonuclease IRE1a [Thalictrum thalictroides]